MSPIYRLKMVVLFPKKKMLEDIVNLLKSLNYWFQIRGGFTVKKKKEKDGAEHWL